MNICIFSVVTCWHGVRGGMEEHLRLLTRELVGRGHEVTVISSANPSGVEAEIKEGSHLYYLTNSAFGSQRGKWRSESYRLFRELHQQAPFDLVCANGTVVPPEVIDYSRNVSTPVVVISHGVVGWMLLSEISQVLSHKRGYGRLVKSLLSFLYYYLFWEWPLFVRCNAVIAVSGDVKQSISRWYGVRGSKVSAVFYGIDAELFSPNDGARALVRKRYDVLAEETLLVFLSVATEQKGLHVLIRAFLQVSNICAKTRLMVVGDGEFLDDAKSLVKSLGLKDRVIFVGYVPHEQAPDYINASDVFVLPTLRQETFCMAMAEAMACRKPVIVSRIGAIPSIVHDGVDGFLVSPGDVEGLSQAIMRVINDVGLASEVSQRARTTIMNNYGVDRMVQGTVDVFEAAVSVGRFIV